MCEWNAMHKIYIETDQAPYTLCTINLTRTHWLFDLPSSSETFCVRPLLDVLSLLRTRSNCRTVWQQQHSSLTNRTRTRRANKMVINKIVRLRSAPIRVEWRAQIGRANFKGRSYSVRAVRSVENEPDDKIYSPFQQRDNNKRVERTIQQKQGSNCPSQTNHQCQIQPPVEPASVVEHQR